MIVDAEKPRGDRDILGIRVNSVVSLGNSSIKDPHLKST
jgi:hypothetical protein